MRFAAAAFALLLAGPAAAAGMGENLIPFTKPTPAPEHPIALEDGGTATLADWRGRVAVVMFWATWCEVCEAEMPEMEALAARHDPERIALVPVSVDEGAPFVKARKWMDAHGHDLPVMVDRGQTLFHAVGAYATPTTIVVDRFGQVTAGYIGAAEWDSPEVNAYLEALAEAESPEASLATLARFTAAE